MAIKVRTYTADISILVYRLEGKKMYAYKLKKQCLQYCFVASIEVVNFQLKSERMKIEIKMT